MPTNEELYNEYDRSTVNDIRREELEGLVRWVTDNPQYQRHLNRESILLLVVRYLQTCVPEETAARVNQYLSILPQE